MVFSIEPGIYLPDQFGIRLEEIVFLRADGPEILSELPRTTYVAREGLLQVAEPTAAPLTSSSGISSNEA